MKRYTLFACIALFALAGCVGTRQVPAPADEYVEVDNPAATMSPSAPATIWVPRRYVENGVPRGGELVKRGYESVTGRSGETPTPQAARGEPRSYPSYYRVLSVDKERVCFTAERSVGLKPGMKLPVHRGGSVVEGIGFVPGPLVGTVSVTEGTACGTLEQGGEARVNDLVRVE